MLGSNRPDGGHSSFGYQLTSFGVNMQNCRVVCNVLVWPVGGVTK